MANKGLGVKVGIPEPENVSRHPGAGHPVVGSRSK